MLCMMNIIIKLEHMAASIPINNPNPGTSTLVMVNIKCITAIQITKSNA